jgi:hypothetical protein
VFFFVFFFLVCFGCFYTHLSLFGRWSGGPRPDVALHVVPPRTHQITSAPPCASVIAARTRRGG